jgi:hypothetical protein
MLKFCVELTDRGIEIRKKYQSCQLFLVTQLGIILFLDFHKVLFRVNILQSGEVHDATKPPNIIMDYLSTVLWVNYIQSILNCLITEHTRNNEVDNFHYCCHILLKRFLTVFCPKCLLMYDAVDW